jgi:CBS-domain-containing membrane protein
MRLFDEKFRHNCGHYILQCLLATVAFMLILLALGTRRNAAIIAALGASAFIAFAMPHARVARMRYLLGGYLVGIAVGVAFHYASLLPQLTEISFVQKYSDVIFGAGAVGLAIFVMAVTDTEHPPAAGIALGLVLGEWNRMTIAVVLETYPEAPRSRPGDSTEATPPPTTP